MCICVYLCVMCCIFEMFRKRNYNIFVNKTCPFTNYVLDSLPCIMSMCLGLAWLVLFFWRGSSNYSNEWVFSKSQTYRIVCMPFKMRWCWFRLCINSKSGTDFPCVFESMSVFALFSSDSKCELIAAFDPILAYRHNITEEKHSKISNVSFAPQYRWNWIGILI